MIVSIALLGFGASGTVLSVFPKLGRSDPRRALGLLGLAAGVSILGSYLLTNWLPFDSFSIAWDPRQLGILALHYIALAAPFFFSGMAVALLLEAYPESAGSTYAVNLSGSALGCVFAMLAPHFFGAEGAVALGSGLAITGAWVSLRNVSAPTRASQNQTGSPRRPHTSPGRRCRERAPRFSKGFSLRSLRALRFTVHPPNDGGAPVQGGNNSYAKSKEFTRKIPEASTLLLLIFIGLDLGLRLAGRPGLPVMDLHLSPYKGYSYAAQYPGAQLLYRRWNAFSRVDVVRSAGIHSIPGLSYRYLEPLPGQDGLFVDGDNLSALIPERADMTFSSYLPQALPFELRPGAAALVLEPRGGLDVLTALALGAEEVTAVESNPLIAEAAGRVYQHTNLNVILEAGRTYLRREREQTFDVIVFSLTDSYHPVRSGAYSLGEDYRYTLEAFQDALARLKPGGLLSVTRWLQDPPSEELRAFALAVTVLERKDGNPETQILAFRGYNTMTILVKNGAYTPDELQTVRAFASGRAFDLVYAPGIRLEETNRYNILPEPVYYQAFSELLHTKPRQAFYEAYPFDVRPPTDDHPFFGHYFKWSQAGQVLAELGHTWQPFGGAGYFVILALLALALLLASLMILLPLALRKTARESSQVQKVPVIRPLLYFGFIGLAFLLVEIPLLQRFILYLGNPAYALTAVLFSILLFSAIGSQVSHRIPHRGALFALVMLAFLSPFGLPCIFSLTLGFSLVYRLLLTALILAPLGFLMGIPFPAGIQWLQSLDTPGEVIAKQRQIPWVWATNGAASVISSVLAALLALTFGFNFALRLGALCYAGALLTVLARPGFPRR